MNVGSVTPFAPVCVTLQLVRQILDSVLHRKERLEELYDKCVLLTTYVILQEEDARPNDLAALLKDRVDKLNELVKIHASRSKCVGFLHMLFLSDGKIDSMERGIDSVVSVMNLSASTRAAISAEDRARRLVALVSANMLLRLELESQFRKSTDGFFSIEVALNDIALELGSSTSSNGLLST